MKMTDQHLQIELSVYRSQFSGHLFYKIFIIKYLRQQRVVAVTIIKRPDQYELRPNHLKFSYWGVVAVVWFEIFFSPFFFCVSCVYILFAAAILYCRVCACCVQCFKITLKFHDVFSSCISTLLFLVPSNAYTGRQIFIIIIIILNLPSFFCISTFPVYYLNKQKNTNLSSLVLFLSAIIYWRNNLGSSFSELEMEVGVMMTIWPSNSAHDLSLCVDYKLPAGFSAVYNNENMMTSFVTRCRAAEGSEVFHLGNNIFSDPLSSY